MADNQPPVKKYKEGLIEVAVWKQEHQGKIYYSVTTKRSYQDGNDEWQETTDIASYQLPVVILLQQNAYNWIKEQESA